MFQELVGHRYEGSLRRGSLGLNLFLIEDEPHAPNKFTEHHVVDGGLEGSLNLHAFQHVVVFFDELLGHKLVVVAVGVPLDF